MKAALPGQLDCFVDGGMVGNAIEPEDLVKPKAKKDLQQRLLHAPFRLADDEPIQGRLPTHDAVGQFLTQVAIGGRKTRMGERRLEPGFHEIPFRAAL